MSSHDVVARVRRLAATRKVGHAGTLDPMATGVLVLGINRATKLLTYLVGCDKTYEATMRLGQGTITDDAEGEILERPGFVPPADRDLVELLREHIAPLTGNILQVPSSVSAIKVNGERSYARVRAGEQVALVPRPVLVRRFEVRDARVTSADGVPVVDVDVVVECSSGTYIRALARDLGAALGAGGHLTRLRRTEVGRFTVSGAQTLLELGCARSAEEAGASVPPERPDPGDLPIVPMADAARTMFATRDLAAAEVTALGYGQPIAPSGGPDAVVAGFAPDGRLVALLEDHRLAGPGGKLLRAKPTLNFGAMG
ncbi:tRNA pseudouridine(55) synthase TruB [Micrococcales bacterium 31B]|nr:tRNA pseudouridine(55) synthase TruB [Micrococcales bacterium 31B]